MANTGLGRGMDRIVDLALEEDIGTGDITTAALVPESASGKARFTCKGSGVLAGMPVARRVFERRDPALEFDILVEDGGRVSPGARIAEVRGRLRSILECERTALNFLTRLSGVATQAARFAESAREGSVIYDTRKTTPGLRMLEKYAARVGGCRNHRMGLYDQVLIKENHIKASGIASLCEIVRRCRACAPAGVLVEIEVENMAEFRDALEGGPDIIMLDDMSVEDVESAVAARGTRPVLIEVSGGVTIESLKRGFPEGVDRISSGAVIHSAPPLDISMKVE